MKIKIIGYDGVNWSIDKDRKNIEYFLSKTVGIKISESYVMSTIYFFVWYNQLLSKNLKLIQFGKKLFKKKIIAVATNDIRIYIKKFNKLEKIVDIWISPNSKISYFLKSKKARYIQIPFYVSPKKFYPACLKREDISKKLNIDFELIKNKILIGSFQRDSLGKNLSEPKWQKHPDLVIKILKKLPANKTVLILAGPRRHYIINECEKYNIHYLFIGDKNFIDKKIDDVLENNLDEEKINLLYNLVDIYIVSSKSEGGPKAVMESALTKTIIYSTDVGLAKDFIHNDLIYNEKNYYKISNFITEHKNNENEIEKYIKYNYRNAINILSEKNYIKLYKNLIKKI